MPAAYPVRVHETRLLIGGEQVTGAGTPLTVESPASEEVIANVALPDAGQVAAAIEAAREDPPAHG